MSQISPRTLDTLTEVNARLGDPVTVFTDTVICDGHGHEVTLWFDGTRAYAVTDHPTGPIERAGTRLRVTCDHPGEALTYHRYREACHGEAVFDLTWGRCWRPADPDLLTAVSYGTAPEQAATVEP